MTEVNCRLTEKKFSGKIFIGKQFSSHGGSDVSTREMMMGNHIAAIMAQHFEACNYLGSPRVVTVGEVAKAAGVSKPTARKYMMQLVEMKLYAVAEIARHTWVFVPMTDVPEDQRG